MEYLLFSVKDVVAGTFNEILLFSNKDLAIRYFDDLCQRSRISKDLQLFQLGTYDNVLGTIVSSVSFIKSGTEVEVNGYV